MAAAGLNIPKKALSLIVAGGAILLFLLVIIIITQVSLGRESREIAEAKAELDLHNKLYPFENELLKASKDLSDIAPDSAGKKKFPIAEVPQLANFFGELIRAAKLEPVSVIPSPESLSKGSRDLSVNLVMSGNILNLRDFLYAIGTSNYVITVETVQAQKVLDGQEFKLRIWAAVE